MLNAQSGISTYHYNALISINTQPVVTRCYLLVGPYVGFEAFNLLLATVIGLLTQVELFLLCKPINRIALESYP